jgi:hypothetical protein
MLASAAGGPHPISHISDAKTHASRIRIAVKLPQRRFANAYAA